MCTVFMVVQYLLVKFLYQVLISSLWNEVFQIVLLYTLFNFNCMEFIINIQDYCEK